MLEGPVELRRLPGGYCRAKTDFDDHNAHPRIIGGIGTRRRCYVGLMSGVYLATERSVRSVLDGTVPNAAES